MDFKKTVIDLGIPTTAAELKAEFKKEAVAQHAPFSNESDYSPLGRLFEALIIIPALYVIKLIITNLMPNAFIKTATGEALDRHGAGRNIIRKPAAKATGEITFYRDNGVNTLDVPAGTRITSPPIAGVVFELVTTQPATFDANTLTVTADVEAVEMGEKSNLATGYYSILPTPISGITRVENSVGGLTSPGADVESDDDYRLRIVDQFGLLADYHVDAVYRQIITSFPSVHTDNVFFDYDVNRGEAAANAYILLDVGEPSPEFLAQINDHINLQGNHGHGDDLQVFALPKTQHDLVFNVWLDPDLTDDDSASLLDNINNFIRCTFRENDFYQSTDEQPLTKIRPLSIYSFSVLGAELHRKFSGLSRLTHNNVDIDSGLTMPKIQSLSVIDNG
ncbi:MAG: baseplate J/gp47 family protein [Algicola sp.]|nr:baseplate J/gp47 family protein [Algicola sp.]